MAVHITSNGYYSPELLLIWNLIRVHFYLEIVIRYGSFP